MCGGRGSRLGEGEKPLVEVGGVAMVDRVLAALADSAVASVRAVTGPDAPETAAHVAVPCVEAAGEGYVADLRTALADPRVDEPVLTVAADLPLLDGDLVDDVIEAWDGDSLTVAVPVERKRDLGVSVDSSFAHAGRALAPAGINVVAGDAERVLVRDDERLAVNVNRPGDLAVARRFV